MAAAASSSAEAKVGRACHRIGLHVIKEPLEIARELGVTLLRTLSAPREPTGADCARSPSRVRLGQKKGATGPAPGCKGVGVS
jgi:hypothetical protein